MYLHHACMFTVSSFTTESLLTLRNDPIKMTHVLYISRLVSPPTDASPVFFFPSCFIRYKVDNEVDKCITQASQEFGALQKSVCLDNSYVETRNTMQRSAVASYTTVCEDGWYGEAHLCRQGWNALV